MKLQLTNINKYFDDAHILKDVSFNVTSGRAMGFLGRNGSGKTTTIRCLMDIFKPNSGQITLDDKKFNPKDYKIGYLPEERGMYAKEKILDQLVFFGSLRGGSRVESKTSAMEWLERFDLQEHAKHKLETLSKSNQQKVQIIQAFINDPDIIILDEPFSGLDPVNSELFKNVIRTEIKKGKLIIFSSHQMSYVEEFCDDITLINNGKILVNDELEKIKIQMGQGKVRVVAENYDREALRRIIISMSDFNESHVEEDKQSLIIDVNHLDAQTFLKNLIGQNIAIKLFSSYQPNLTDIFVKLVTEADRAEEGR